MSVAPTVKRRPSKRPPDHLLAEIIMAKAGVVSAVAQAVGASPRQVRRWRDGSKRVGRMFQEAREAVLDLAESKLIQNIKAGRTADIIWYLKCQGKSRGWVERSEVIGANGDPLRQSQEHARAEVEKVRRMLADPEALRLHRALVRRLAGIPSLGSPPCLGS